MYFDLSNPRPPLTPQLPDLREITRIVDTFTINSTGFEMSAPGMATLKSFAMLVGHTQGARGGIKSEARYAYYRRCQQFRRNGEQCKAPAMKGEPICHRHAEQADMERRRAEQRRAILSRPGAGLGSFRAIQRTIGELAGAILAGSIDAKAAGWLMMEIQTAIRLRKIFTAEARRRGERRRGEVPAKSVKLIELRARTEVLQTKPCCSALAGRPRRRGKTRRHDSAASLPSSGFALPSWRCEDAIRECSLH
jgi:hypothetical protein